MWRRTVNKQVACNACGLYYKLYGIQRPIEMRKDVVYPRNRYSKLSTNTTSGQSENEESAVLSNSYKPFHKNKNNRRRLKSNSRHNFINKKPNDESIDMTYKLSKAIECNHNHNNVRIL